jgi:hypothetical protein
VELTAAGIEMAERLFLAELAAQQARLKGLSYAQRRRLLAALRVLNRMLDSPAPTVAPKQEASRSDGRIGLGEEQNAVLSVSEYRTPLRGGGQNESGRSTEQRRA